MRRREKRLSKLLEIFLSKLSDEEIRQVAAKLLGGIQFASPVFNGAPERRGLIDPQAYGTVSDNGLIRAGIKFGMARQPTGAAEVSEALQDLAKKIHAFAKGLEEASVRENGGDA